MAASVWEATMPADQRVSSTPLDGDERADVVVVGAGFTGLWTAYYLTGLDPDLRVVVLDAGPVGFGASGRNGGWCSTLLPMSLTAVARVHGRHGARALQAAMHGTVDEIARVVTAEGIDAGMATGGTVTVARNPAQLRRLAAGVDEARRFGVGADDLRLLGAEEAAARCRATGVVGGTFARQCAALHPLRLVHGLAAAAQRRGVVVHEHSPAVRVQPGRVETARGAVVAGVVVLATEAFTVQLAGRRRQLLPVYSLMVATEPLGDDVWREIGLAERETFADGRHLVVYGQRTADGRLAFGGRGAPYHFRSRIDERFDTDRRVRERLVAAVRELFPALADVDFPYHWGGPLAVARDWHCTVQFERTSRMGFAGGYAGDGVATTNLAGRTLAELITGRETGLRDLPWVGHRSRPWEIEPLRWLGVNGARVAAARADRAEATPGRRAERRARRWRRLLSALSGR